MSEGPAIVFTDVNERQGAFHRRMFIMGSTVAFGLFALTGRLVQLQVLEGRQYQLKSIANQYNLRLLPPLRGLIVDRNGALIAGNRPSFRVLVMRNEIDNIDETLDKLGYVLPQTQANRRRILRDINQSRRFVPTAVATDLNWEDFSRVNLYAGLIPGVVPDMDQVRVYHYGGAFSHIVGYVSKISQRDLDAAAKTNANPDPLLFHPSFRIGKTGVEKAFDKELRGAAGAKRIEVNSTGNIVEENGGGVTLAVPGKEIRLTLDADIQQRAVDVFGKESGAAVMMDVHTGDVLCMTSCPAFDPNMFVSGISSDAYKLLHDYDHNPLLDKALSSTFPPGSTFKTMVALAALESGYDPNTNHTCNGVFPFGNHVFKCDQRHGALNLHEAIVTSCDVYFYQCALAVGPDKIAETARKFGLGQIFDIGIDGQKRGIVPDRAWKREYFAKRDPAQMVWFPGETPSVGIGQGATNVNPLQSCVMTSRLANGKKAILPRLIKSIGGVEQPIPTFPDLACSPEHIAFVKQAMASVVTDPRGTASSFAKLGLGPVMMAGKTGTAQSHEYKGGRGMHGASGDWVLRDHAWFVAFAPHDAPRYAMSVLVEHGGFGASTAAPKAREIMRVALLKDPDIQKRIVQSPREDVPPANDPPDAHPV